jgi:hypothetical protein
VPTDDNVLHPGHTDDVPSRPAIRAWSLLRYRRMPRKQRFKPSRKPKPIPQSEDAMNGRLPSSAPANDDNVESRTSSPERDQDSTVEPDPDQQSR